MVGEVWALEWGSASSHAAASIETKRESTRMSESRADLDQCNSEISPKRAGVLTPRRA
jgi:hypothetical protein